MVGFMFLRVQKFVFDIFIKDEVVKLIGINRKLYLRGFL